MNGYEREWLRVRRHAGSPCKAGLLRTMSSLPPDTRAMRQTLYAALAAFPVGFVLVLVALGLLVYHVVTPDARWWEILHISINSILISAFGGLCFSAVAATVVSRIHYRRGAYRCRFCDRPLKGPGIPCECPEAQAL